MFGPEAWTGKAGAADATWLGRRSVGCEERPAGRELGARGVWVVFAAGRWSCPGACEELPAGCEAEAGLDAETWFDEGASVDGRA